MKNISAFKIEFDSHNRIFQESMALIYSTKNVDTLNNRYEDACEHLDWILSKKLEGFPIKMNHDINTMMTKLNEEKNTNILRIAELSLKNFEAFKAESKSKKVVENRVEKLLEILNKCLKYLVHASNYNLIHAKIKNINTIASSN